MLLWLACLPLAAAAATQAATRYHCSDGHSIRVAYLGTNAAVLTSGAHIFHLKSAVSADGARYTGDGWQWWAKGMQGGTLTPLAPTETIASAPGIACRTQ